MQKTNMYSSNEFSTCVQDCTIIVVLINKQNVDVVQNDIKEFSS